MRLRAALLAAALVWPLVNANATRVQRPQDATEYVGAAGSVMGLSPQRLESATAARFLARGAALGYELDALRYPSRRLGWSVDVVRFVPKDWDSRQQEATALIADVLSGSADTTAMVVQVDAVRSISNLPDASLDRHDWTFWKSPDGSWRLIGQSVESYVRAKADEAQAVSDAYAFAYWRWWQSVRASMLGQTNRAFDLLTDADASLVQTTADPMRIRMRVASGLLRVHALRHNTALAARYARDLARIVAEDLGDSDYQSVYSTFPSPHSLRSDRSVEATIEFAIDADGRAAEPRIVHSSPPAFGRAVVAAMDDWWYVPRIEEGVPVRTEGVRIVVGSTMP